MCIHVSEYVKMESVAQHTEHTLAKLLAVFGVKYLHIAPIESGARMSFEVGAHSASDDVIVMIRLTLCDPVNCHIGNN